jgi:hypothetical protein
METYRSYMKKVFENIPADQHKTLTGAKLREYGKQTAKSAKQDQMDIGKKIFKNIKEGHASGISTCGSIFSDSNKRKYENCQNHAVTATGVKCVNGRLKIEITNSWGIGCKDNPESKNLVNCQRDIDGVTNGRAWVDFGYLSDQSIRLRSF